MKKLVPNKTHGIVSKCIGHLTDIEKIACQAQLRFIATLNSQQISNKNIL
jgi:hypothetical protein